MFLFYWFWIFKGFISGWIECFSCQYRVIDRSKHHSWNCNYCFSNELIKLWRCILIISVLQDSICWSSSSLLSWMDLRISSLFLEELYINFLCLKSWRVLIKIQDILYIVDYLLTHRTLSYTIRILHEVKMVNKLILRVCVCVERSSNAKMEENIEWSG